jgi:hypothetical protein
MIRTLAFSLLVAAPLSIPAVAAPVDNSARTTPQQNETIRQLEAVAARDASDGAAFTDLAAAYLRVGRVADANTAYRKALALDNVTLTTPTGNDIWSHDVARRALAGDVRFSSR